MVIEYPVCKGPLLFRFHQSPPRNDASLLLPDCTLNWTAVTRFLEQSKLVAVVIIRNQVDGVVYYGVVCVGVRVGDDDYGVVCV